MLIAKARRLIDLVHDIRARLERVQEALGRIELRQTAAHDGPGLQGAEFRVFSQWGEDGIIQRLLLEVSVERKLFVEFGVQDYTEANTRFLLVNDNWYGLVMDGDAGHIATVRRDPVYWRYNLKAERAFVDRDNVNDLIRGNGIEGDIGLLSIDIDGNDYWVWKAITCVRPRILVLEYNALFGPRAAVTVPYDPTFFRTRAHYSNLFWGASLEALTRLSRDKGYILVGCNNAGNNAFYVRADLRGRLEEKSVESAFVQAQFRESRDAAGLPTYLDPAAGRLLIEDVELWDIDANSLVSVRTALEGILKHAE